jgi:antitoxin HicB
MRFTYPARLRPDSTGELIVSFRDLPECLTSGADEAEALAEAADALEEAIAGRIDDAERIPVPSTRRSGEHLVAVPAITAAKAALALALVESGLSPVVLAQRLRVDEKAVRRMLDPRHRTAIARIERALRVLGQDLVVETRAA